MRLERWLPAAWALLLTVLLLGPVLAPGHLLSYDMVWVPDLALRADALGLGPGLPRAVPSDALVAVLDEVVPAQLLQKAVLVGALVAAGAGAAALVPDLPLPARCVAVALATWNPYVVERLVLGHWTMLVAYGALPWLVLLAARTAGTGRLPWQLLVLVPLVSLSPSAGIMAAVVVLALGGSRLPGTNVRLGVLLLVANAPWLVSGLLHAGDAVSDPRAAPVFALHGAWLPAPLEALALGGVWNNEVVPASRETPLALAGLLVVLVLAGLGARSWRGGSPPRVRHGLVACWAVGLGAAVLTWASPDAVAWLSAHVPGGGLLRDGSRLLGLCVPLVAVLVAHGVTVIASWLAVPWQRALLAASLALAPVALLPDAAWGAGLPRPADYPPAWAKAAEAVDRGEGRVLVLPLTSYRQPGWNDAAKVLDPAGRWFAAPTVISDQLVVDGVLLAGEDPLVREAAAALAEATPAARAAALADAGISRVLVEVGVPGDVPEVEGDLVLDDEEFALLRLPGAAEAASSASVPGWWRVVMALAWSSYVASLLAGAVLAVASRRRLATDDVPPLGREP